MKWTIGRPRERGWYWCATIFRGQVVRVPEYLDPSPKSGDPCKRWEECVAFIPIEEPPPKPLLEEVS